MADFFQSHKNYYEEKTSQGNQNPQAHILNELEQDLNFPEIQINPEKQKKQKPFMREQMVSKLKWEHVQDEVRTNEGKYGDNLINKGAYILKGFIPEQNYLRPIIRYYETEDKITLKVPTNYSQKAKQLKKPKEYSPASICFSFKNKKLKIYSAYGNGNIRTFNIDSKDIFSFFYPNFMKACNEAIMSLSIGKDTHTSRTYQNSDFNYTNNSKVVVMHLGLLLIEKAYSSGLCDKDGYKALKKSFKLMHKKLYARQPHTITYFGDASHQKFSGYPYLITYLVAHLQIKPYLTLLKMCKTNEEYISHWEKVSSEHYVRQNIDIILSLHNLRQRSRAFKELMHETDLNRFFYQISGQKNKGAIKKVVLDLFYKKNFASLDMLMACKEYIKRDWIIQEHKHLTKTYIASRELATDGMRKKLKTFMREYLTTDRLKREFFLYFICHQNTNNCLVSDFTDIIEMYLQLPKDLRPQGISLYKLHDRLCDLHNRERNFFQRNTTIPEVPDSYIFEYNKFNELTDSFLNEKVGEYDIKVPKTAKEIRDAGKDLRNCLASYVYRVQKEENFIMFLETNDQRKYAVDIILEDGDYKVKQFYGERNSMPKKEDFIMFEEYIKHKFEEIQKVKETT